MHTLIDKRRVRIEVSVAKSSTESGRGFFRRVVQVSSDIGRSTDCGRQVTHNFTDGRNNERRLLSWRRGGQGSFFSCQKSELSLGTHRRILRFSLRCIVVLEEGRVSVRRIRQLRLQRLHIRLHLKDVSGDTDDGYRSNLLLYDNLWLCRVSESSAKWLGGLGARPEETSSSRLWLGSKKTTSSSCGSVSEKPAWLGSIVAEKSTTGLIRLSERICRRWLASTKVEPSSRRCLRTE